MPEDLVNARQKADRKPMENCRKTAGKPVQTWRKDSATNVTGPTWGPGRKVFDLPRSGQLRASIEAAKRSNR